MAGKFIVIEGLEGAGKSTAHQTVQNFLENSGVAKIITTREPGGTPLAEKLRQLIKHHQGEIITDKAELLMLYAARVQLVETVIKPALAENTWVIGDRHDWSSQAYQGAGRGLDVNLMANLRQLALDDFTPDFTILLDVDPAIGLARARQRGALDRIEQQAITFFENARTKYLSLAQNTPNCAVIDANQPLENVQKDVRLALARFLERGA